MGSYVRFMREMERGDRLQEAAANLAAKIPLHQTARYDCRRTVVATRYDCAHCSHIGSAVLPTDGREKMVKVIKGGKVVSVRTACNRTNYWIRSLEDGQWYRNASHRAA